MSLYALFQNPNPSLAVVATVVLSLVVGCSGNTGPELGYVEGNITLDGKPLDGAEVQFEPSDSRPSIAITDDNGHYVLQFTGSREGATVGTHTVRILSARGSSGGEGDGPYVKARPELLPPKYHVNSTLTAEVKSGNNTFDFDLEAK